MIKYILDWTSQGRALIPGIGRNFIGFNINGFMEFDTPEEAEAFRQKWKNHFFDLSTLDIVPIDAKTKKRIEKI